MFDLDDLKTTFDWPVTVRVPDAGKFLNVGFTGRFKLLGKERVDELIARARSGESEVEDDGTAELVEEIFDGWNPEHLKLKGAPLEETQENRKRILDNPLFRNGIVRAYFEAVGGRKVKRGN